MILGQGIVQAMPDGGYPTRTTSQKTVCPSSPDSDSYDSLGENS